jgi:hypothetical protein
MSALAPNSGSCLGIETGNLATEATIERLMQRLRIIAMQPDRHARYLRGGRDLYRNTARPNAFGIGVAVGRRLGSDHASGA